MYGTCTTVHVFAKFSLSKTTVCIGYLGFVFAFCNIHFYEYKYFPFLGITCWEIENFLPNPVDEGT